MFGYKIKNIISVSFFVLFAIIVVILVVVLWFNNKNMSTQILTATSTTTTVSKNPPIEIGPGAKTLSLSEVAKHNQASDCWQAISGNVYDFTSYLDQHPAGAEIMITYCGKDATQAYDTKGGQGDSHSGKAERMLPTYFVGRLTQ